MNVMMRSKYYIRSDQMCCRSIAVSTALLFVSLYLFAQPQQFSLILYFFFHYLFSLAPHPIYNIYLMFYICVTEEQSSHHWRRTGTHTPAHHPSLAPMLPITTLLLLYGCCSSIIAFLSFWYVVQCIIKCSLCCYMLYILCRFLYISFCHLMVMYLSSL